MVLMKSLRTTPFHAMTMSLTSTLEWIERSHTRSSAEDSLNQKMAHINTYNQTST